MIKYFLKDNEYFYGLAINDGTLMPFNKDSIYEINLTDWHSGNQASGLLFSNLGNIFFVKKACKCGFYKGELYILSDEIKEYHVKGGLKKVHDFIRENIFKKCNINPPIEMFMNPQFNTWIEMGKDVTQEKVLKYANDIIKHGYKPGVLMIDDCWSIDYGNWEFDLKKFLNPKFLVKELHKLGFKVILWICPFVDFTSDVFNECVKDDLLVKTSNGSIYASHWWNGVSAVLDLTNPKAVDWFKAKLNYLIQVYQIDGFKLDAGDPEWYRGDSVFYNASSLADQSRILCEIGEEYQYSELRVGFNNGISGIAHRLRDKYHSWDKDGLNTLIPNAIAMGLMGYPFLCPDMIGGGVLPNFEEEGFKFDQELFIRYAQVAAFMPMMQFSLAPWKCLSKENQKICLKTVELHEKYLPIILNNINKAKNGIPIIQSVAYRCNDDSYSNIKDEFFLGDDLLVCPQIYKAKSRKVVLPVGEWLSDLGEVYQGGEYEVDVALNRVPTFKRIK